MAELRFHRSLYSLDAIQGTATLYGSIANCSVAADDNYVTVQLEATDPRVEQQLPHAFANHVLFETVKQHRDAEDTP